MIREDAQTLIAETIREFHELVMEPLHRNIHHYDRQRYANAVALNEEFSGYADVVRNLEELSASFQELDNFQMSQLLSLCWDISELYGLPVFKDMPDFIPDRSTVRYVAPGMSNILSDNLRNRDGNKQDKIDDTTRGVHISELNFVREVLGPIGERAYRNSEIKLLNIKGQEKAGFSPIGGTIYLGSTYLQDPMSKPEGRNLLIHEVFHQVQYIQGAPFSSLVMEALIHDRQIESAWVALDNAKSSGDPNRIKRANKRYTRALERAANSVPALRNVYDYEYDLINLFHKSTNPKLSDLPYYEAQAQLVGFFAQYYYKARHDGMPLKFQEEYEIKKMVQILKNSGFTTEATRWVDANLSQP
jgi:hypothetical protein